MGQNSSAPTKRKKSQVPKPLKRTQSNDIRILFDDFDQNKDGYLELDELKQAMKKIGQDLPDSELATVFNAADTDKDGVISRIEFKAIVKLNPIGFTLRALFVEMDINKDGFLDRDELRQAFLQRGISLTDAQLTDVYVRSDINQDGAISFQEFASLMTKGQISHTATTKS